MINKISAICLLLCTSLMVNAQHTEDENKHLHWHLDFEKGKCYGAGVLQAYEYIQEHKLLPQKEIIVAVIEGGLDTKHEDLQHVLWVNPGEIPDNGIDDDKNGYIDDIHGWNFLGNAKGEVLIEASPEGDREFMRLISKFEKYGLDSTHVPKKDLSEYMYFRNKVIKHSVIGKAYESHMAMISVSDYADIFTEMMQQAFGRKGQDFTIDEFKSIAPSKDASKEAQTAFIYYGMLFSRQVSMKGKDQVQWKEIIKNRYLLTDRTQVKYNLLRVEGIKGRSLIGDKADKIKDKYYGNNRIDATHTDHGTHTAGIIGADRNNKLGIQGVASVKLMNIRAVPDGDEYDKDIALAIEYAIDNGAHIINMSFGKPISPHKKWVDKALLKAQKKGILVVHAAGNSFSMINADDVYPSPYLSHHKGLNNFIRVGSNAIDGHPAITSNYGKQTVDVFAPGVDIYSLGRENSYTKMSGTSMAAPVVSGIAAMIWSYFPHLKVTELKQVLQEGVTDMTAYQVEKPKNPNLMTARELIPFEALCDWAGIINAYQSFKLAHEKTPTAL